MFSKIKYISAKTENKEHIKFHFFTGREALYSKIITIYNNFVRHTTVDTCDRQNTAVLRVYKFYVDIYCTRLYLPEDHWQFLNLIHKLKPD